MSRVIQVGDYVTITTSSETQTYPIERIEGLDIYISIGDQEPRLLVPINEKYQMQGLDLPHQVKFMANDLPTLSGDEFLDLAILESLDDESLDAACQIDDYTRQLCEGDQLWNNKIISKFAQGDEIIGRRVLSKRPRTTTVKDYYLFLSSFSTADANLALAQYNAPRLDFLMNLGYYPDIPQQLRENIPTIGFALIPDDGITLYRLRDEVIDFLREAELGPQVTGNLIFNPNTNLHQVDEDSVKAIPGTSLNDLLYFIQAHIYGQPNPLYGLVTLFDLILLFTLHIFYSGNHGTRISATPLMREHLGGIMRNVIDHDVAQIVQFNPNRGQEAHEIGEQLKEAINNPDLEVNNPVFVINGRKKEIFNPNSFPYAHLNGIKILSLVERISPEILNDLRPRIAQVYSLIPGIQPENAPEKVSLVMDNMRHFARAYRKKQQKLRDHQ